MVQNRPRLENPMIVCHCFAINDARIRALIDDDDTVRDVMFKCGAGRDCGGCLAAVKALVTQHRDQRVPMPAVGVGSGDRLPV